jgi:uncharacterized protein (DUF58 family)
MLLSEIQDFRNLELLAKQIVEGFVNGLHRSPFHGFSVEFAEHRPYNPGESVRYLDWKLYGRTDRMFIKRFQEETNLRCRLVLDISPSMYFPGKEFPKMKFTVLAAAAITLMLKKQRDAFGLSLFQDRIVQETDVRSTPSHFDMVLHILQGLIREASVKGGSALANTLHEVAEKTHRRSLILLFTDMFSGEDEDALFKALQHLKYGKNEVIVFHITDKKLEQELAYDDRPYKFTDMETGEEIKLQALEYRDTYMEQMKLFMQRLRSRCRQYRIDFIEVDAAGDFRQVLLPFLMKRQKMY